MITVIRPIAAFGRLRVDLTLHEGTGRTAVQVTRTSPNGPEKHFTIFPAELDQLVDAIDEGADLLLGPAESDQPETK